MSIGQDPDENITIRRGRELYYRDLRPLLDTPENHNKLFRINVETGEYLLYDDPGWIEPKPFPPEFQREQIYIHRIGFTTPMAFKCRLRPDYEGDWETVRATMEREKRERAERRAQMEIERKRHDDFYDAYVRPHVYTRANVGKLCTFDMQIGDYEVHDERDSEAGRRLRERRPNGEFIGVRIGYTAVYSFAFGLKREDESVYPFAEDMQSEGGAGK